MLLLYKSLLWLLSTWWAQTANIDSETKVSESKVKFFKESVKTDVNIKRMKEIGFDFSMNEYRVKSGFWTNSRDNTCS